jgi:hypothetical protein
MRALFAAPVPFALGILLAGVLPAAAADRPMTAEQIRELARRDLVWCENYRADKKDCETLTLVSLLPDGSLRETGVMRLAKTPDLKMVIDGRSQLQGDRVCSVFGAETVKLRFLLNNRPVPPAATGPIEAVVREAMSEFEGKTLCQTFYRGASEAEIRETITVDGERREDLESVYRLQKDEAGLDVRPAAEDAEESIV